MHLRGFIFSLVLAATATAVWLPVATTSARQAPGLESLAQQALAQLNGDLRVPGLAAPVQVILPRRPRT